MPVRTNKTGDGKTVTITVSGRFDFTVHEEFRSAYENTAPASTRYVVDLGFTDYVDSSALGMLLLLREHAGGAAERVALKGARPDVKKILSIANFDKLFAMA